VVNTRTEPGSRGLQVSVAQNRPPIQVNATAGKATNLNADKLDGKSEADFYAAGSKVADSSHADLADSATSADAATSAEDANTLDGKDSTEFLGKTEKAADADKLDGLDSSQLPRGFYEVKQIFTQASTANGFAVGHVLCNEGDQVVGGGYSALDETSKVIADSPDFDSGQSGTQSGWVITWKTLDPNTTDDIRVSALCADFGETHNN
jgi:hypothetical protein